MCCGVRCVVGVSLVCRIVSFSRNYSSYVVSEGCWKVLTAPSSMVLYCRDRCPRRLSDISCGVLCNWHCCERVIDHPPDAFKRAGVTGDTLSALTPDAMTELGVTQETHQRSLLTAARFLKACSFDVDNIIHLLRSASQAV